MGDADVDVGSDSFARGVAEEEDMIHQQERANKQHVTSDIHMRAACMCVRHTVCRDEPQIGTTMDKERTKREMGT